MKTQVLLAVMAVTSLTTTGCCGFRNLLFGRGAACGSCASTAPALNVGPPAFSAPCGDTCGSGVAPYAAPYGSELNCGCEGATSYAPASNDAYSYNGGYGDGSIVNEGMLNGGSYGGSYPNGYVPGIPVEGGGDPWQNRVVPGSVYTSPSTVAPAAPMSSVNGQ